jgi:predicted dehydrogenase
MTAESRGKFRCAVVSVVKHGYVPRGVAAHPRFQLVVVADDADQPDWVHERNQVFADEFDIPYVKNVEQAWQDYDVQVAVVSSEAERHCDLSIRAAEAGIHVVQDKPMSTSISECDRLVAAVEQSGVKFLMWNRNYLPALLQARQAIEEGQIGQPYAIHVDFYFAKDSGPPKGSRADGEPVTSWLDHQIAAHVTGADGGVGQEPMGELKIEGIYPLGYIQFLLGARVQRVFARTTAHFHQVNVDHDVEDLATVTLEMEQDILGTLCIGRIGAASHPDIGEIKIHVLGSQGALVISEARPEVAIYYRGQPAEEFRHRRVGMDNDYLLMENFAQAIDNDGSTVLDARVGREISGTVQAAIESGRTGKPVDVV